MALNITDAMATSDCDIKNSYSPEGYALRTSAINGVPAKLIPICPELLNVYHLA
jgi:hypothetical protein